MHVLKPLQAGLALLICLRGSCNTVYFSALAGGAAEEEGGGLRYDGCFPYCL